MLAKQIKVPAVHLFDQEFGLAVQVTSPDLIAALLMYDIGCADVKGLTMFCHYLIGRIWKETIIDWQSDSIRWVEKLRLWKERAALSIEVTRQVSCEHLFDCTVHIACFVKFGIAGAIRVCSSSKMGHETLIWVP